MRFNDFLFAAHGAAMCVIIYSQFFPRVWGFEVGKSQKVSRPVLGIWWACVVAILVVMLAVWSDGPVDDFDIYNWAWIDVVRNPSAPKLTMLYTHTRTGLYPRLRQTSNGAA